MKNKKLSITQKILAVTLIMFIVYTIFGAAIQTLFFESFYTYTKRDLLTKQIESFSEKYITLSDDTAVNKALLDYTGDDTYMLILNENGDIVHSTSYQMTVRTDSGEEMIFFIDHLMRSRKFETLGLGENSSITVGYMSPRGPMGKDGMYVPVEIRSDGETVIFNDMMRGPGMWRELQNVEYVTGRIKSIPSKDAAKIMMNRDESTHAAMDWMRRVYSGETLEEGKSIHYVFDSEESGDTYCVVVKNISVGEKTEMIFAVTTLRPVTEAVGIMQTLQIMWFVVMTAIVIVIATVFTRSMTKPIKDIAAVTTRMKNLDFSKKCDITSTDELGMLAENINSMSEALDGAIRSLKEANEKLTDDIERERKAEQNRREFTAAVSHELKTPLAIIRAYSEGILDGVSDKKKEHYLKVIADETKKMDALVLDMLDNSKLESGAETLDLKKHSLTQVAQKEVNLFCVKCEAKGAKLHFEADEVEAVFDIKRIEQVVTNFISNAVHHVPEEGNIYVSVKNDGGAYFEVENEGEHIAEEELDKIWDRFYKVDKSRERSVDGGTGLGLSIAKNILALHNADYFVRNTQRGVAFGFVIKKQ